jgi:hypothetical protein
LSDVLQHLGVPSYVEDGLMLGGFYASNAGAAIYNPHLRPFTVPVPFLLVRPAVISDWRFFVDNEDWLSLWARRYGASAVRLWLRNYAACRGARPQRPRAGRWQERPVLHDAASMRRALAHVEVGPATAALSEQALRCGLRSAPGPTRQSGRGARDSVMLVVPLWSLEEMGIRCRWICPVEAFEFIPI